MNYNHSRSPLYQKVLNLSLIIVFFIFGGAIAFIISEDINFLDAIWLSLMTVTTVGFGVPENFSNWGKIISIFLMLFGVGTVLYAQSVLTLEILNGNILKEYKQKKNLKHIIFSDGRIIEIKPIKRFFRCLNCNSEFLERFDFESLN